ncbi:hypothetical protein MTR_3g031110 [Medicago truncatula]|uniref:Exocyst complex subunit Exo70 C-terminal domain-containing protein n=1 Tax=Medicago truncatula TaxID=3880 RepID=G7IWW5_MEDTR|nr:hypothetical protein MTR_3g031110 [Medicago truncatula]
MIGKSKGRTVFPKHVFALKILFPSERRLRDRVFSGLSSSSAAADLSFMEVCRGSAIQLLNFSDAAAIIMRFFPNMFLLPNTLLYDLSIYLS